jgi:hypothetical protein
MIPSLIFLTIILLIILGFLWKKAEMKLIKRKNFTLFQNSILAVFGGFVGAIFGVMVVSEMEIEVAFFLVIFYLIFIWGAIWILRLYSEEE